MPTKLARLIAHAETQLHDMQAVLLHNITHVDSAARDCVRRVEQMEKTLTQFKRDVEQLGWDVRIANEYRRRVEERLVKLENKLRP